MTKSDLTKFTKNWPPKYALHLFLNNGFCVVVSSPNDILDLGHDSMSGRDGWGRTFCLPLDTVVLAKFYEPGYRGKKSGGKVANEWNVAD